jgi:hypothetical protein
MNRCWIVYSDDVLPLGIEYDYWVLADAEIAYGTVCQQYLDAHIKLYICYDRDEPNERWELLKERYRPTNTLNDA